MTQLRTLVTVPLMLAFVLMGSSEAFAQNVNATGDIRVDAGQALNASSSINTELDTSREDTSVESDNTTSVDLGTGFTLNRTDASVENSSATQSSVTSVNTQNDLEAYAASSLRANDAIEGIDAKADSIELRFSEEAKLLGIIPISMVSRVEVRSDGSVTVTRPWYRFLVTGVDTDASAELESRVQTALQNESLSTNGQMNVRTQAVVLAEIVSALGGTGEVTAQENANASADIGVDMSMEGEALPN